MRRSSNFNRDASRSRWRNLCWEFSAAFFYLMWCCCLKVSAGADAQPTTMMTIGGARGEGDHGGDQQNSTFSADIVNGVPADIESYRFFAIPHNADTFCSAALVHPDVLLTAAHCYRTWRRSTNVCLGTSKPDCSDAIEIVPIAQDYIHPDYVTNNNRNDLMLIKLASPISSVPVVTWNANDTLPEVGSNATVIGLGWSDSDPVERPDVLQELAVSIGDPEFCEQLSSIYEAELFLCADGIALKSGACRGDSGGPLLSPDGVILGVVSFGFLPCGAAFDGYVRISAFKDWIKETICGLSEVPPEDCGPLPPNWPAVSPWEAPCGRQNCGWLLPGTRQNKDVSILFFWNFCYGACIPMFLADGFQSSGKWRCGDCS